MPTAVTAQGLDLRISIEDSEPLIWRRLHLPENLTIDQFHLAVQAAFGWENRHLYGVRGTDRVGRERRIVGINDEAEDLQAEPASSVVLSGGRFDPAAFDLHAANRKLRMLSLHWWPQPLGDPERDSVIRPVRWLLHEASGDGLELTKDGYLKPTLVKRAMEELGWAHPAMGKGNRETHTRQVAELRQHLMEPARDSLGPPLLTDGGVKFFLDMVDRARTFPPEGLRLEQYIP